MAQGNAFDQGTAVLSERSCGLMRSAQMCVPAGDLSFVGQYVRDCSSSAVSRIEAT